MLFRSPALSAAADAAEASLSARRADAEAAYAELRGIVESEAYQRVRTLSSTFMKLM